MRTRRSRTGLSSVRTESPITGFGYRKIAIRDSVTKSIGDGQRRALCSLQRPNDLAITLGNDASFLQLKKRPTATALAGWGERIRTAKCNFRIRCESASVPCRLIHYAWQIFRCATYYDGL